MIGNHLTSDVLQVEARDVEPEPKSFGQHPGVKGAWGIDRLESRYVAVRLFAQFHAPLLGSPDRWAVSNREALPQPVVAALWGSWDDVFRRTDAPLCRTVDNNGLRELVMEAGDGGRALSKLRILRVSGNKLQRLDGEFFPSLRTLYADNNALTGISHCGRMKRLENLSLRNQAKGKL